MVILSPAFIDNGYIQQLDNRDYYRNLTEKNGFLHNLKIKRIKQ